MVRMVRMVRSLADRTFQLRPELSGIFGVPELDRPVLVAGGEHVAHVPAEHERQRVHGVEGRVYRRRRRLEHVPKFASKHVPDPRAVQASLRFF